MDELLQPRRRFGVRHHSCSCGCASTTGGMGRGRHRCCCCCCCCRSDSVRRRRRRRRRRRGSKDGTERPPPGVVFCHAAVPSLLPNLRRAHSLTPSSFFVRARTGSLWTRKRKRRTLARPPERGPDRGFPAFSTPLSQRPPAPALCLFARSKNGCRSRNVLSICLCLLMFLKGSEGGGGLCQESDEYVDTAAAQCFATRGPQQRRGFFSRKGAGPARGTESIRLCHTKVYES